MGSLHQCLSEQRFIQFIYLVKLKTNLNELNDQLHTPLVEICSTMKNTQMACKLVKILIENGAQADITDSEGLSLLHLACRRNIPELVRTLLRRLTDCPINTTDMYGNTPLHYAASHENMELVQLLLPHLKKYQVNTDCRNKLGFTPLLIAASNGRLEVARYIASNATVSTNVYDSLYFISLDDWLHIYFDWPIGKNILSPTTPVTKRDSSSVKIEKNNLVPVNTRPSVNSMLETFSRENSAAYSSRAAGQNKGRVPQIVVTRPSSDNVRRRACTAPTNRVSKQSQREVKPLRFPVAVRDNSKQRRISLKMSRSDQQVSTQEAWSGKKVAGKDTFVESTSYSPRSNATEKASGKGWCSLTELASICSEQLSDSYRKTITPTWVTTPAVNNDDAMTVVSQPRSSKGKDGSKAASILLGMIGKSRRLGSEASTPAAEEEMKPSRASFKFLRNLKRGAEKKAVEGDKNIEESQEDRERVEKATAILNRVLNTKKKPPSKPEPSQPQTTSVTDEETAAVV